MEREVYLPRTLIFFTVFSVLLVTATVTRNGFPMVIDLKKLADGTEKEESLVMSF